MRNCRKKKEVASIERPHFAGIGTSAGKALPATVDKNYFRKDRGYQPKQTATNVEEEERPGKEQGFPESQKSGNADKESGAFIDLGKDAQKNAPPSDPFSGFF